jgi:hypothetical protein
MNQRSDFQALGSEHRFRAISYTLLFLMMACGVLTVSILLHNLLPGRHSNIAGGILLFILIDRLYTYRHLKSMTPFSSEWVIALGAQWIVIILFSRLLLSYANGPAAVLADISFFTHGYFASLFTAEFVITLLLAGVLWHLTGQYLELLDEIGLDMKRASEESPPPTRGEAIPAHQRMANLIFTTGVILVLLAALTRLDMQAMQAGSVGLPAIKWTRFSGGEAGALLYFVFGLAFLSLCRLMSLQTYWNRQRIPVSSHNLPRQWAWYSLFFLLVLTLIVGLLPVGDSLGFFSLLGTLLGFLLRVLIFISYVIVGLVLTLFSLPFLLLGKAPPFGSGAAPGPMPSLPMPPLEPMTSNATWEMIKSVLLWGSLLLVTVYALIHFVRQHESILAAFRQWRLVRWLTLAWQWLYTRADTARGDLARVIAAGWQSLVSRLDGKLILPRSGWINLRTLPPRQRVYFFYLAMVRRSGEQGLRRGPSQTPSEYAVRLEKSLPIVREDIDSITATFVRARYSRQAVSAKEAGFVKTSWDRIRRALQNKSKSENSKDQ